MSQIHRKTPFGRAEGAAPLLDGDPTDGLVVARDIGVLGDLLAGPDS